MLRQDSNSKEEVSQCRGVAIGEGEARGPWTPISISEPKKVYQFQFQASVVLVFMGNQKLYGPEMSRFLTVYATYLKINGSFPFFLTT